MNKSYSLRGFTLLEVLVSAAILSIVLAVLLSILSTGLLTWRTTQGKIEVDNEGRSGALLLMQDIDNIILPANPNLWPRVGIVNNSPYFQFLTLKPLDYQDPEDGNVGDVCYVQYHFGGNGGNGGNGESGGLVLMRSFYPSKWTYDNILKSGVFPSFNSDNAQLLSTNILGELKDSVRGFNLYSEAGKTGFVLLGTNNPGFANQLLPIKSITPISPPNSINPPVGIEINFGATDMTAIKNLDLLANPQFKLRNSGYFSLRFDFPKLYLSP